MNSKFKDKAVLILGAGRSGLAAAGLLARENARIILVDDRATTEDLPDTLIAAGLQIDRPQSLPEHLELMVVSPGIPDSHSLIQQAREQSIEVIDEVELGYRLTDLPIIAITGTNGKTTTTEWFAHVVRESGSKPQVCGNIGIAFCEVLQKSAVELQDAVIVLELSSYQLERIQTFLPDVGAILNLTPDHLVRHGTFENYCAAKQRIFKNMQPENILVLNADDAVVWPMSQKTKAGVWGISLKKNITPGVFIDEDEIMVDDGEEIYSLADVAEISLRGEHNLQNALAVVALATICGIEFDTIRQSLMNFGGVEHRIEHIAESKGVNWFNDSKATNIEATEVALKSFDEPIVLLCGGEAKDDDYSRLKDLIKRKVKQLCVFGADAEILLEVWGNCVPETRVENISQAVHFAFDNSAPGDVILLSPACASFDQYKNFELRGQDFKNCVKKIIATK